MIIYNTTFHVENETVDKFLTYIKDIYVPAMIVGDHLSLPRLTKILTQTEESEGSSCYSLQFSAENEQVLDRWMEEEGISLLNNLIYSFSHKVLHFSTLLDEIDLS